MNYQNEQAHNLAKMQPTSVFLQPVRVNLVSFAQQAKEANYFLKKMVFFFFFRRKGMYRLPNFFFSVEMRAGATTSPVSFMTLLLSFVIYNLH